MNVAHARKRTLPGKAYKVDAPGTRRTTARSFGEKRGCMIDCDVHQNFNRMSDLLPWVDPAYRDYFLHAGFGGFEFPNYKWW